MKRPVLALYKCDGKGGQGKQGKPVGLMPNACMTLGERRTKVA